MVVLKKIRGATIIDTLIALVILVIVFVIAGFTINNTFKGMVKKDDFLYQNRLREVSYFLDHNLIEIPFYEETNQWEIQVERAELGYKITSLFKPMNSEQIIEIHE